uniref:Uncharacterized protein n=1 Tax=Tanacetum cinerariifolium TaxID=118510 RepID=A0A6L2P4P0_TANCI|nr:hypothetical protein [Tanacetum cinerariifolium]
MMVPQHVNDNVADDVDDNVADDVADVPAADAELTPRYLHQLLHHHHLHKKRMHPNRGKMAKIDADEDVTLEEVAAKVDIAKDAEVAKDADDDEAEPAELKEDVVFRDLEETATPSIIVHSEPKSKDKGKGILVEEPKPFKKQAQIEQDEAYVRELKAELNKNINWNDVTEQYFNSNLTFLGKSEKELEEEASIALKRKSESSEEKAAKKQKLDEEVEELKKHLQIVPNDEDDVYTEATPLALKVPIVDYQIHTEHNKPYYKIIRADGIHQLFLSFISLLRNFDRKDLEMLWQIVQERFTSSKPKNFSDDFLLTALKTMFEKPDVEAQVWKNQRGNYRLAKVKSWKLLESYGVHIITFTTIQMILLVERRYHLTRFTLDQMLNNVRLKVKEESEVSLELLRFIRRQQQEGYRPDIMGEPLSLDRVFEFPVDKPKPHPCYDFFAPGLLPGYAGNPNNNSGWIKEHVPLLGELGVVADEPMVGLIVDEFAEPIVEAKEQVIAPVVNVDEDIAMLFDDDDFEDDDSEGVDEEDA